ncbi:hypothetical protein JCM8202_002320 [Rhodotorula sphaerocarpa]
MTGQLPAQALEALRQLHPHAQDFHLTGNRVRVEPSPTTATSSRPDSKHSEYLYRAESPPATQLVGEAESLRRTNDACPAVAPTLVDSGQDDQGRPWMLCEWHDLTSLPSSEQGRLAELVAQMHLAPPPAEYASSFGFPVPTNCGETVQDNTIERSWAAFFGKRRIGDVIDRIGDKDLQRLNGDLQQRVIPHLLGKLDVKPALLHGDLWSGNARYSRDRSAPITFDPASYYGHSEADLGIMRMFGGFSSKFFERYHELVPKSEPANEYEQRMQLYEAFHHLNHALIFGGGYKSGAMSLLRGLVDWADEKGL